MTPHFAEEAGQQIGIVVSTVERESINWIWRSRLAIGKLTILDGDPGLGKSTLYSDIAARITTGRTLPGDEDRSIESKWTPAGVVIVTLTAPGLPETPTFENLES